jgi:hypothetical protein
LPPGADPRPASLSPASPLTRAAKSRSQAEINAADPHGGAFRCGLRNTSVYDNLTALWNFRHRHPVMTPE